MWPPACQSKPPFEFNEVEPPAPQNPSIMAFRNAKASSADITVPPLTAFNCSIVISIAPPISRCSLCMSRSPVEFARNHFLELQMYEAWTVCAVMKVTDGKPGCCAAAASA